MLTAYYRKKIDKLEKIILFQWLMMVCIIGFILYTNITSTNNTINFEKTYGIADSLLLNETVILESSYTVPQSKNKSELFIIHNDEPNRSYIRTPIVSEPNVEENIIPITTFKETQITGNEIIDIDQLRETISIIAPDLLGIEDEIIQVYKETGIKPSFQLAKFCLESGYGTSGLSKNKNNIAGWGAYSTGTKSAYDNAMSFSDKGECVIVVGNSINNNYIAQGKTTIKSIALKYCPSNSDHWANSVTSLMYKIDSTYKSLN